MPKKSSASKAKPLYRTPLPAPAENNIGQPIAPAHFELREDGSIANSSFPTPHSALTAPRLIHSSDTPFLRLYHGNCLELLDAIAAKHPGGRFDAIFADPPYFLSNGGITCHAGKMVKVHKGDWDQSRGPELNHEFNLEWLRRCQRVLKPDGTIWVSGTHHVIFSIGYAMQQLGYKILNDIAWEKPNPPPNLSCRYFTHSTETLLWAAKNEKSKHLFNYQAMRQVTGKQMKTVWRKEEFLPRMDTDKHGLGQEDKQAFPLQEKVNIRVNPCLSVVKELDPIWTMTAPGRDEKEHGKHPTQKPAALVERCLLASTNPGDLVLDPFLGGGTTAIAALKTRRGCVGIELSETHAKFAAKRIKSALGENTDFYPPPPPDIPKRINLVTMPMVMSYESAWELLVAERVDIGCDLVILTKADIESVTGNELRLMAKMDSSTDVPAALRRHGYFILPVKNGEYILVRGNGFHMLEKLSEPPTVFRPQLDFDLVTLNVGDSEMQHLDYCYNIGLFERFAEVTGLRQTIRGRKRMPAFEFSVGGLGPIHVQGGVQVEVDSGCEGRNDIILIEAKGGQPTDFIVRQLFYPYRKWRQEIPQKRIRPWFFCSYEVAGRRLYKFWEYAFADEKQYQSLTLRRGEAFFVEPIRARLTVEELLRPHVAKVERKSWDVPQADSFWRVAEIPLLIEQGINNSAKVAAHYKFDPRQSSYYRQAAEFLGLVMLDKTMNIYRLTDFGREYTSRSADERRQLLAGILAQFPPMRATLELSEKAGEHGIGCDEIAALLARHSAIGKSTPRRRAATLLSWLRWLQEATGAVQRRQERFLLN